MKKSTLYIKGIPLDVKLQFKAICVRQNTTMTKRIEELMRKEIKKFNG